MPVASSALGFGQDTNPSRRTKIMQEMEVIFESPVTWKSDFAANVSQRFTFNLHGRPLMTFQVRVDHIVSNHIFSFIVNTQEPSPFV